MKNDINKTMSIVLALSVMSSSSIQADAKSWLAGLTGIFVTGVGLAGWYQFYKKPLDAKKRYRAKLEIDLLRAEADHDSSEHLVKNLQKSECVLEEERLKYDRDSKEWFNLSKNIEDLIATAHSVEFHKRTIAKTLPGRQYLYKRDVLGDKECKMDQYYHGPLLLKEGVFRKMIDEYQKSKQAPL